MSLDYFVAILFLLAAWHWFAQSMVASTQHKIFKHRALKLREKVEEVACSTEDERIARRFIVDGLRGFSVSSESITLGSLAKAIKAVQEDAKVRARVQNRREIFSRINNHQLTEAREIHTELIAKSIFINHLGWLPYAVVPAILLVLFSIVKDLGSCVFNWARVGIDDVSLVDKSDIKGY